MAACFKYRLYCRFKPFLAYCFGYNQRDTAVTTGRRVRVILFERQARRARAIGEDRQYKTMPGVDSPILWGSVKVTRSHGAPCA